MNLVGNAIKFTETGEIVVRAAMDSQPEDQAVLKFSVTDTGIGISPEKQARMFEAFEQADTSTTREYGGTGLGLSISRQLVELMEGEISIESAVGHGTTFHFTAKFGIQKSPAPKHETHREYLQGLHVLVVDDNETNRLILHEQTTAWGMHPVVVESGGRVHSWVTQMNPGKTGSIRRTIPCARSRLTRRSKCLTRSTALVKPFR